MGVSSSLVVLATHCLCLVQVLIAAAPQGDPLSLIDWGKLMFWRAGLGSPAALSHTVVSAPATRLGSDAFVRVGSVSFVIARACCL